MRLPIISACLIVKDEAEHVVHALDSIKNYVDEIIVVDTGSTDCTIDVCKKYTDKVLQFPWGNDFSAARNESIKQAKGDWILLMDADEYMERASMEGLKHYLSGLKSDQVILLWKNYEISLVQLKEVIDGAGARAERFTHFHLRMFKNRLGFHFKYSLHEKLISPGYKVLETALKKYHYGYASLDKNRQKRNYLCVLNDLRKYPGDLFVLYNLGRYYALTGELNKMQKVYDKVIRLYLEVGKINDYFLLQDLYFSYITALIDQKVSLSVAEKLCYSWLSRSKEFLDIRPYFYLGKIKYLQGQLEDASKMFTMVEKYLPLNQATGFDLVALQKELRNFVDLKS